MTDAYRRALSQGMTPMEAELYAAEEQEWERIEIEEREKAAKLIEKKYTWFVGTMVGKKK